MADFEAKAKEWNLTQLREALQDIWANEITVEDFNKYIDSLPQELERFLQEGELKRPIRAAWIYYCI